MKPDHRIDVRETVPDSFLLHADPDSDIGVPVDAAPGALARRQDLSALADRAGAKKLFQTEQPGSLRELALREVAPVSTANDQPGSSSAKAAAAN